MRESVRVLLLEMPPLLRDILESAVRRQDDCELLTDTRGGLEMLTPDAARPDVVVLGLTASQDTTLVPALFARWPGAQIVTVMQTGDDVAVYELVPRRRALSHMSPSEIVETLRSVVYERRERPHV